MAKPPDLEDAYYLIGIRDGFRLARANEQAEVEDLIAEIKGDIGAKMRAAEAELAAHGGPVEPERDPKSRLN